jgi:nucleotide-binding universal stress UspA family protein
MKRFKNILAVIDGGPGDKHVIERAVALAKVNKAKLTFGATRPKDAPSAGLFQGTKVHRELDRLMRKERQANLEQAVRSSRRRRQPARSRVLEGKPFVAIIQEVLRGKRDIVLFAEGPTSLRNRLFGSTALHLLRKCPCPVWVLSGAPRRTGRRRVKRVLAAIDPATLNQAEKDLNTKILELATSLAHREKAEVHVVHCWSVYGEALLSSRRGVESDELASYRKETRQKHQAALESALAPFEDAGHEIHGHLIKGDPGEQIPRFAEKLPADIVVMGTVARTGLDGVFIGNTAESVLQRLGRSILAVKPDGFVSPVRTDDPE